MQYQLNLGNWNRVFAVPCSVVEQYIKIAPEDYLKVLLVFLCRAGQPQEASELAALTGVSDDNLSDALSFWQQHGILEVRGDVLSPAEPTHSSGLSPTSLSADKTSNDSKIIGRKSGTPAAQALSDNVSKEKERKIAENVRIKTQEPVRLSSLEISARIESTEELKWVISEAERMFGRFLTQSETAVLVTMFDYAGIHADVIVMIIEYCLSIGKSNLRSIEKTAYAWADLGLDTHQKIEAHITELTTAKNNETLVRAAFGLGLQSFSAKQKEFIRVWMNDWGFSVEMIRLAYDACLDHAGKISFPYINKVLAGWRQKNISTPQQVEENEQQRQVDHTAKAETTFRADDFDDLTNYSVPDLSKKRPAERKNK